MHSVLIGGEQQATFLLKAQEMGLTSGKYVFMPYDTLHYSLPYTNVSFFPLQNNSRLREAYDAVLTITMASEPFSFNEAFAAAKRSQEITLDVQPEQVVTTSKANHLQLVFLLKCSLILFFHHSLLTESELTTNVATCAFAVFANTASMLAYMGVVATQIGESGVH